MGVSFDSPAALLLLPPLALLVVVLHLASRRRMGRARRRAALAARLLLISVLVGALSGIAVVLPVDGLAVVYVVDMSDSMGTAGREAALAYIRTSLVARKEGDLAGVVAFGGDALVERLPTEITDLDRLASTPVRAATDIGAALRLASALFPDDVQKRIVLLSDGNDTTGSGETEASLAAARAIQVDTVTTGLGSQAEALVERLTAPSTAHVGEKIQLQAFLSSTVAQQATARLFVNGEIVASQPVALAAGETSATFDFTARDSGFLRFRAVVDAPRDTFAENNRADASTIVKGPPRVLVVEGDQAVGQQLVSGLASAKQTVDAIVPEALPTDLATLTDYDSIVLVDVPKVRLPDKAMETLQVYVRDLGRGLVAIGGPDTYGAGGLANTPLEETLPVDMGVKDKTKQPDVALVVVIDKSGSMAACHCNSFGSGVGGSSGIAGVQKVDIGKEAIIRAASALSAADQLGVVAFDESAHWVVKTEPLGGITDLQGQIAGITAGGTTNIYTGLDQAVKSLEKTSSTRRHIILLTDGWSNSGQYDQILAQMKADGITLSTVGAGGGANPFLAQLAAEGGGRYYAAANPAQIPDIFLKETQQVSGQQIVEEPFYPVLTSHSPIVDKLATKAFPQLLGYDGTTAKAAAQTVLVTGRDDPLLAQWQYGLGRAVAWTSDTTGRWAKNWVGWTEFSAFFSGLVAWTFPGEESGGIEASFAERGGRDYLRVESTNADSSPRDFYSTSVALVGPDLTSTTVSLSQVAPGVYEVPLASLQSGAYAVRVTQTKPGAAALGRTLGLVAPTAAEYRLLGTNQPLLAAMRAATGGRELATPADAWVHDLALTSRSTPLWPWLLVLALLLWPLDVALRRVAVGRRELADWRRWLAARLRGRETSARTPQVEGMLAARGRTSEARAAIVRQAAVGARGEARSSRPGTDASGAAMPTAGPAPVREPGSAAAPGSQAPASAASPASAAASGPAAAPRDRGEGGRSRSAATAEDPGPGTPVAQDDTLARLAEAKRRKRG
jgi:Ca-activated chloride channel family protein